MSRHVALKPWDESRGRLIADLEFNLYWSVAILKNHLAELSPEERYKLLRLQDLYAHVLGHYKEHTDARSLLARPEQKAS